MFNPAYHIANFLISPTNNNSTPLSDKAEPLVNYQGTPISEYENIPTEGFDLQEIKALD